MAEFEIKVNRLPEVLANLNDRIEAALEAAGQQAVSHAKSNLTAAGRIDTGALRGRITHAVNENECHVGTNVHYAVYHEVGTGIYAADGKGRKTPWRYQDEKGEWHTTRGLKPTHFLRDAVADHVDELKQIMENELSK